jgi:hypothetical protein
VPSAQHHHIVCSMATPKWVLVSKALEAAMQRLEHASPNDIEAAFAAAGEALWWAVILNEYFVKRPDLPDFKTRRNADPRGKLLLGVDYARNAVGHHVAVVDLLEVKEHFPATFGDFWGEWCWRPLSSKAGGEGREIYNKRMVGRPARETLRNMMPFLNKTIQEVEGLSQH